MSDAPQDIRPSDGLARPEALLRVPVGFSSPLWGFFAGAAMSGSAWWWMTRWTQIENLEALFGAAEARAVKAATLPIPAAEAVAEAALESLTAVEEAVEAVVEPVALAAAAAATGSLEDLLSEASPTALIEGLEASADVAEVVGGESAPISPAVAAMAPPPEPATEIEPETPSADESEAPPRPRRRPSPPRAD